MFPVFEGSFLLLSFYFFLLTLFFPESFFLLSSYLPSFAFSLCVSLSLSLSPSAVLEKKEPFLVLFSVLKEFFSA